MMDRAYQNMLLAAKERLEGKNPLEIAKNANIVYDEEKKKYLIDSMGKRLEVTWPDYDCTENIENWHHLLILHYLDMADGTALSGRLISFTNLKDGVIRGTKFDRTVEIELQKLLKGHSEEELKAVLKKLGGVLKNSKADICAEIPFFPMYPMTMNIWLADDEYPISGKILLDASADHYLTIEDAVTAGDVLLGRIAEELQKKK